MHRLCLVAMSRDAICNIRYFLAAVDKTPKTFTGSGSGSGMADKRQVQFRLLQQAGFCQGIISWLQAFFHSLQLTTYQLEIFKSFCTFLFETVRSRGKGLTCLTHQLCYDLPRYFLPVDLLTFLPFFSFRSSANSHPREICNNPRQSKPIIPSSILEDRRSNIKHRTTSLSPSASLLKNDIIKLWPAVLLLQKFC